MTTNFEQQQATQQNLNFSRSAPTPQHGQRADKEVLKRPEPLRSHAPKPGQH
jgi:hypothetical protein